MKVLYIVDPGIVGGATCSFVELVTQMQIYGVEAVVCTSNRNSLNELLDNKKITNYALGYYSVLEPASPYKWKRPIKYIMRWVLYRVKLHLALNKIKKCINIQSIDLIHTNSARNDLGCFLNKKYKIPHIMHIREFADADFGCISLRKNYISVFNRYTTTFVSISDAVKNHWNSKGIDCSKNIRIYNGVSFEDITKSDIGSKKDKKLKMVIVGGVCKAKGQHLILEAINIIPTTIKENLKVDIVGWYDPLYMKLLKKFIDKYKLHKYIYFAGALPSVNNILKDYQIGLMCSMNEGFGRVTAEYMFAGLGVIASNSGANPELIEDGITGLLFESDNAASLAHCITRYYNNRELLINCSEKANVKAHNKFTKQSNAKQIYQLYQSIYKT